MDLGISLLQINMTDGLDLQNKSFQSHKFLSNPRGPHQTPNGFTYAEEVVQLLAQQIQQRLIWDHQKWLFSVHKEEDKYQQVRENKNNIPVSLQKNQKFIDEKNQQKLWNLGEIKTPDLAPDQELSQFQNLILETKNQGGTNKTKIWHCSCQKSKCLKMYCQCFRNGSTCVDCQCVGCSNNNQADQKRQLAISSVKQKEPTAFIDVFQYKGCRCTKSSCQKAYCDCFANGLMCGKYCKCRDCLNCKRIMLKKSRQNTKGNRMGK